MRERGREKGEREGGREREREREGGRRREGGRGRGGRKERETSSFTYLCIDNFQMRETITAFFLRSKILYVKLACLQWRVLSQGPVWVTLVLWGVCMKVNNWQAILAEF